MIDSPRHSPSSVLITRLNPSEAAAIPLGREIVALSAGPSPNPGSPVPTKSSDLPSGNNRCTVLESILVTYRTPFAMVYVRVVSGSYRREPANCPVTADSHDVFVVEADDVERAVGTEGDAVRTSEIGVSRKRVNGPVREHAVDRVTPATAQVYRTIPTYSDTHGTGQPRGECDFIAE